jgi:protoporphyrinogen oxidase
LKTDVTDIKPQKVTTSTETVDADAIIVTHPIDNSVQYTRFATVTIECNAEPVFKHQTAWGGIFLHRSVCRDVPILSIIHNGNLYNKSLNNTLTLNIALTEKEEAPVADSTYTNRIVKELHHLFPSVTEGTIVNITHWERTMPIGDSKHIAYILENQGKDNIYYAGDWLGCPSMETALTTGKTAADLFLNTIVQQPKGFMNNPFVGIGRKN